MVLSKLVSAGNYISVNKSLIKAFGLEEAVIFGELCSEYDYWKDQGKLVDDMFYCTTDKLEKNTALSEYQQRKAIKKLEEMGVIQTELKGMPATRHFKIVEGKFLSFLGSSSLKTSELDPKFFQGSNNIIDNNRDNRLFLSKDKNNTQVLKNDSSFLGSAKTLKEENNNAKIQKFLDYYNSLNLPIIRKVTDKRKKAILNIMDSFNDDEIKKVLDNFSTSDFLLGKITDFKANIDWILKEGNFIKILEGKYNNNNKKISFNDNAVSESYTDNELKELERLDKEREARGLQTRF